MQKKLGQHFWKRHCHQVYFFIFPCILVQNWKYHSSIVFEKRQTVSKTYTTLVFLCFGASRAILLVKVLATNSDCVFYMWNESNLVNCWVSFWGLQIPKILVGHHQRWIYGIYLLIFRSALHITTPKFPLMHIFSLQAITFFLSG